MLTILVVDDDANIRKLLDVALKREGFSVITARDGNEAFVRAIENPPDVAILDVMMPGLHGYELCRRLRANPSTTHIKIIFVTARSQPYDEQAGLDAGADLFLGKPVMPNELADHIRALVASESDEPQQSEIESEQISQVSEPAAPQSQPSGLPPPSGRLIACFSLTPQVGVTTLAVNLALAFALSSRQVTPLIEFRNTPGNILDMMGLERADWSDFDQETELEWRSLEPRLVKHPMGVRVLSALTADQHPSSDWIKQAILLLQDRFPRSVADVTSKPDASTRSLLLLVNHILLVTTPEVQAVRNTLRALEGLRALNYPESNILLVVNHVQATAQIPVEKIQAGIKHNVFAVIPHTPSMPDLVKAGRPLLLTESGSAAARAIGRMAMQITKL